MTDCKARITVDPEVLVGKPIIKYTRTSVERILGGLADGWSPEQILEADPGVSREDVLTVIAFTCEVFGEEPQIAGRKAGESPG